MAFDFDENELLDDFLQSLKSENVRKNYLGLLSDLKQYSQSNLLSVTVDQILKYLFEAKKYLKPITRDQYFYKLRKFYEYACVNEYISVNPLGGVQYNITTPKRTYSNVSKDSLFHFLNILKKRGDFYSREHSIVSICYGCLFKPSEALDLLQRDLVYIEGLPYFKVKIEQKEILRPINQSVMNSLQRYICTIPDDLRKSELPFFLSVSNNGSSYKLNPIQLRACLRRLQSIKKREGISGTWSYIDIRNRGAQDLYDQGYGFELISKITGHEDIRSIENIVKQKSFSLKSLRRITRWLNVEL